MYVTEPMELRMLERRDVVFLGALSVLTQLVPARPALAADCQSMAHAERTGNALLDRYAAAINAHDTSSFPELFTATYIQHSGRSPSGLAAQMENFQRLLRTMPDLQLRIDDRIIAGDKVVARNTYAATHTQTILGIAPTGKSFSFRTIDIWRVEDGKFAEHWDLTDIAAALNNLRAG
jgi:steroid delta-isomerase-like uncharacterized protein